jgi:UTP--glucose-1-phosphate uridylyltransferase
VIDSDGEQKSVLSILIEQALSANIDEVCVVVWPGDESRYEQAAGKHASRIRFVAQSEPRGYGHAVYSARGFTDDETFLHLVGDHLYVNASGASCASRLVDLAKAERCCVSSVQVTREALLPSFGAVGGRRVPGRNGLYRIETVIEKPTPTEAEQKLVVPGVRAGSYLCFFGMHVLTPSLMDTLGRLLSASADGRVPLSAALAEIGRREQYLALEETNRRFDIGAPYGLLMAQFALALCGRDRTEVLTQVTELLTSRELARAAGSDR